MQATVIDMGANAKSAIESSIRAGITSGRAAAQYESMRRENEQLQAQLRRQRQQIGALRDALDHYRSKPPRCAPISLCAQQRVFWFLMGLSGYAALLAIILHFASGG